MSTQNIVSGRHLFTQEKSACFAEFSVMEHILPLSTHKSLGTRLALGSKVKNRFIFVITYS